LVGPELCVINVVIFVVELVVDDVVDFFLDEPADVVEDCFFLFWHVSFIFYNEGSVNKIVLIKVAKMVPY